MKLYEVKKNESTKVADGRLRVDNLDFMNSLGPREFSWLRIDANNDCNLKCAYCRVPRSNQMIDGDELLMFLKTKVAGVENLQFGCGMEPTLDMRLADLMLMAADTRAKPIDQFVIQTNGTLLHLHDHNKMVAAGLNRMSVSLDSLTESVHVNQRGGSDVNRIITNLQQFRENCPDVKIQIICVVTSANIDHTLDLAQFAADFGVERMAFRQMVYVANHPNTVESEIAPLIVSSSRFYEMKDKIKEKFSGSMNLSFYDNDELATHRKTMRAGSYYDQEADKPFMCKIPESSGNTDLLEGKQFFVLRGFMKSGTNWISRLLNLHPHVSCSGEFHWQALTARLIDNIENSKLLREKEGLRHEMWLRLDRFMKECMVLANHPSATWIGDRTPAHIAPSVIIDAKIFNMVRDGRDVLISRAYHFYNNPGMFPKYAALPETKKRLDAFRQNENFFIENPDELLAFTEFVHDSAHNWSEAININENNTKDMGPERYLELRYEEAHRDIEKFRTKIYRFLGVNPRLAGPLGFNTSPGFAKEMPSRFLRKGQVGDWRNYMSPEAKEAFNSAAGQTLCRLGYAESLDW